MTWKIRHEGSPRAIEGLNAVQILEGLQDGLWEPTDEVLGPDDGKWTALENHPQFAEAATEIEPPPPSEPEDESRIDMNPLIDVTLVLLIFFILTTSYAALQKVLEMPNVPPEAKGPRSLTPEQASQRAIKVEARQENGKPVIQVEDQPVELKDLPERLSQLVKETHKGELLLKAADDVEWGTFVSIQDAAKGAQIQKILYQLSRQAAPAPGK
jgi:biopolymer transport protein ExbD